MGRIAYALLAALGYISVIAIGTGVPIAALLMSVQFGLNAGLAGIIAFVALVAAAILGFFLTVFVFEEGRHELLHEDLSRKDREALNMLRAHARATLEELDGINAILKDIRDLLRVAGD